MIDVDRVLTRAEVRIVVGELRRKAKRGKLTRRNLILFNLATFAGLRASEICGLRLGDIRLGVSPSIRIPATLGKGSKARTVPLTWDTAALADIAAWLDLRRSQGASDTDHVLLTRFGGPLERHNARMIYQRACRIIGRKVTIHAGRHTFATLSLNAKRRPEAVQFAMGHASLLTLAQYIHLTEPDEALGSLI